MEFNVTQRELHQLMDELELTTNQRKKLIKIASKHQNVFE